MDYYEEDEFPFWLLLLAEIRFIINYQISSRYYRLTIVRQKPGDEDILVLDVQQAQSSQPAGHPDNMNYFQPRK